MANIIVKMKDGTVRDFPHQGPAGAPYTKALVVVGIFVVIEDTNGTKVYIPSETISEIIEQPIR